MSTTWQPAGRPAGDVSRPKKVRKQPPGFVIELAELSAGTFSVRAPTGNYTAPPGGAPNYTVPGPIAALTNKGNKVHLARLTV